MRVGYLDTVARASWRSDADRSCSPYRIIMLSSVLICATGGCTPGYVGTVLAPPVQKVILFEVSGPYGGEFTDMLSIELAAACKNGVAVVRARSVSALAPFADTLSPDSIVRDLGAQAYIKGSISAGKADEDEYTVLGTFRVFDAQKEGLIGGIANAMYTGIRDSPTGSMQLSGGGLDAVHRKFAARVARELARGLGY